ncbi:hypothetical protein ATB98_03160 [Sinorhizobium saheli]|uniref:Uncharacterized protein n=1 Tax=Sinorhizobium saheli TaxID=36856 RepID=A0A178YQA8_SINSA|nr:hypothetical protein ATB98_03160 [Sinorhizobium saheli]
MHDPLETVEGGKARRRRLFEIGEDVVLDDRQAGLVRKLEQAMGDERRQRRAGRVMKGGIGDVEARPVLRERCGEAVRVGTGRRVGYPDHPCLVRPEQRVEIEVARVVDENHVARLQQEAADEVDRLRTGFGEHDLVRRGLDAVLRHAAREQFPQRQQAERRAVVDERRAIAARKRPQGAPQRLLRHP